VPLCPGTVKSFRDDVHSADPPWVVRDTPLRSQKSTGVARFTAPDARSTVAAMSDESGDDGNLPERRPDEWGVCSARLDAAAVESERRHGGS
jgi:hypothetical protein